MHELLFGVLLLSIKWNSMDLSVMLMELRPKLYIKSYKLTRAQLQTVEHD